MAEVLITLGVIGVVAAVTLPTLLTNVQERVRQEQVRTVKYKFTKATEKMNSLGLIGSYGSDNLATERFVEELKKHMTIAKICKNNELDKCWPSAEINAYSGSGTTLTKFTPNDISTGQNLKALALSTKNTQTVGIVTGDGVPMILVYSPNCSGFDEAKQYTWSVENGKPVTNATTNCVSAIFDINGAKGPNKIGTDVRTLNSIFGSVDLGTGPAYGYAETAICKNMKRKYGFRYCPENYQDYWAGAIYACDKLGLHLPTLSTLSSLANSLYGTNQIGPYTIYSNKEECSVFSDDVIKQSDAYICTDNYEQDENSSLNNGFIGRGFWSTTSSNVSTIVVGRTIRSSRTYWVSLYRNNITPHALCVGD